MRPSPSQSQAKQAKVKPVQVWPYVTERRYKSGRISYLVDARTKEGGERKTFDRIGAANTWAAQQRAKRENEGTSAFQTRELAQFGWSATKAIEFALEYLRKRAKSQPVGEAINALLAFKEPKVGEIRLADIRNRLDKFSKHFGAVPFVPPVDATTEEQALKDRPLGGRLLADITAEEIRGYLDTIPHATTRNDHRKEIVMLWRFAKSPGQAWVPAALDSIEVPLDEEPEKSRRILTVEQAAELMKQSIDEDIRAMNALVLFGGVRVAEVEKLDWSTIDFKTKHIEISAQVSKVDRERFAPISANLAAWLKPIAKTSGPIVSRNLMRPLREVWKAAKLHPWTPDWHRHSFISYRRVMVGDSQTAMDAGTSEKIIKRHYKRPVLKTEAKKFWAIVPSLNAPADNKEKKSAH